MLYDVIIVGAGPSGIFTAYELTKNNKDLKVLMIEKGRSIEKRICPKRDLGRCIHCAPSCRVTTGFSGAGAFSDGKLSLSPDVGGILPELIGFEQTEALIKDADGIYLNFGADSHVHGAEENDAIRNIRRKAIQNNLKLIECPIRHLGTEEGYRIYSDLQKHLSSKGVEMRFETMVTDLIVEDGVARGVQVQSKSKEQFSDSIDQKGNANQHPQTYAVYGRKIALAVGREGAEWLHNICRKYKIKTAVGTVDIGVRVEVRDEIMKELNDNLYESKLVYYTPTFDDKVRVFCSNPSGEVATEYYDRHLAVVNGHAYKSTELKTRNTNFALLVSKNFTEPFKSPIEYGKHIAMLGNMLSGNRIIVQRYGDFKRGRRTTDKRLNRNNITPTLKDAVPGDLSLVLPYRIMKDLEEMIEALDGVVPGLASDELLLYGVEVKFYSNKILISEQFETNLKNLYALGDGAGITRGLMQSSAMGLKMGRILTSVATSPHA
ncbi:MAG: FAD-dependent oxidoreductase [Firmicutes bacterium]|nr:FAD-dependent oxidoreductase [Bacillota bacterium]